MKKIFNITTITVIILILGIVILFCSKINEISIIENIKQKIAQTEEIQNASEFTTIDVTDLEDNGNLNHEHIFKTKYDENKHWEECTVCEEKINEKNHSYTSNWTMGSSDVCNLENVNKFVCSCGYSYESTNGRKGHTMETVYNASLYWWGYRCKICYYYAQYHDCILSNGLRMNCTNLGICKLCGTDYRKSPICHVNYVNLYNEYKVGNEMYCHKNCSTYIGKVNRCELIKKSTNVYELHSSITVPNGAIFNHITNENYFGKNVKISNSISTSGTTWTGVTTITFTEHNEMKSWIDIGYYYYINNTLCTIWCDTGEFQLDTESPTITIENNSEGLNEWSKIKPIVISGTENYCNTVIIKIVDENENTIFEGRGNVINEKYSVSCVPEIECDTIGKTFTVIVTDNLENSMRQEFTIAKVDNIPPTPTSKTEILGDWAKSKDFTFTATDYGIGQVSIAFNDIKDLQLAKVNEDIYSRDYKFTGDVYQPKQLSVMYKDGLGNTSMQKITINKIDNTAPTITKATIHNSTITVTSHDEHETLGEGSGVIKYRYLASEEKLESPTLTTENSTEVSKADEIKIKEIYKMKYIYVVAEDYVGNISEVYELKVPELKLTATSNPNTSNGKGEIILDWSSYDVRDKYFVIYRKKENQENWETIVSLEQKLTGSTYTDILANDVAKPNKPSITIIEDTENNNINITGNSSDNGTNYTYYIEAYDSTGTLLSKSN